MDNFPLTAAANSSVDLPPVPRWNAPPDRHVAENTPLFIGFTRNWRLLQQTVVSYITGGWPPGDIYVVENTGTMFSNRDGLLTLQNPFYFDYHRLTTIFGINIVSTPTLLTFAQLQNFYVHVALDKGWEHYFWSHMDVVAVSDEEYNLEPYQSLYMRAVEVIRETLHPDYGKWAARWFAYDRLSLVRTKAYTDVGGWDTMIPFYMADCDMHERLFMKGFKLDDATAAKIWDVSTSLDDLMMLYQRGIRAMKPKKDITVRAEEGAAQRNSPIYQDLLHTLDQMQHQKSSVGRRRRMESLAGLGGAGGASTSEKRSGTGGKKRGQKGHRSQSRERNRIKNDRREEKPGNKRGLNRVGTWVPREPGSQWCGSLLWLVICTPEPGTDIRYHIIRRSL